MLSGSLAKFARIGSLATDTADEALQKEILVLSSGLITALAVIWVVTYWALDLIVPALIPLTYQLASVLNLVVFARTKRYRLFRLSQLG